MKGLGFFISFLLFPLSLFSNHIHWLGEYDTALHLAQKEKKPLLILVVKKNSKLCNTIIYRHLMNHPYIETINDMMIAVMVTYEGLNHYPTEMYYTTIFPTLFLVDSQNEIFLKKPLYGQEISKLKSIYHD